MSQEKIIPTFVTIGVCQKYLSTTEVLPDPEGREKVLLTRDFQTKTAKHRMVTINIE